MVLEEKYCNFQRHFHQLLNIRQAQHWEIIPCCTHPPNKSLLQQNFTVIASLLCIVKRTLKIATHLLASLLFPIFQEKINIFRGYMAWFGSLLFPSKNYDTWTLVSLPHSGLAGYGRISICIIIFSTARDQRSCFPFISTKPSKNKSDRTVPAWCYFDKMAINHQGLLLKSITSVDTKIYSNKEEHLKEFWVCFSAGIIPQTL